MLSIRNIQFSKLLKAEGRFREFNFRKSANEGKIIFNVDVTDDRNNRILFRMQKEDNGWKIQSKELPVWIINHETTLCELIENELQAQVFILDILCEVLSSNALKTSIMSKRHDLLRLVVNSTIIDYLQSMHLSKEHLSANNNYRWTDEFVFDGTPSRRLFDRHNGNQLLFIINLYASQVKGFSETDVSKIEGMLLNRLPEEIKSEISVLKWLHENETLSVQHM